MQNLYRLFFMQTIESILSEKNINLLRYLATKNANKELPQRRAYLGVSYEEAKDLANKINAKFISSGSFYGNRDLSRKPIVVYFDEKWASTDNFAWQNLHLFIETPPRYGGPSLVIEVYKNEEAFTRYCPSRNHLDWLNTCCFPKIKEAESYVGINS
jgi:hypothetical protein